MSWTFQKKTVNGKDLYRIYTTVSDGWLTDWLTRNEVLRFMYQDRLRDFKVGIIEMCQNFPDMRIIKGTHQVFVDNAGRDVLAAWRKKLSNCTKINPQTATDEDYDVASEKRQDFINVVFDDTTERFNLTT